MLPVPPAPQGDSIAGLAATTSTGASARCRAYRAGALVRLEDPESQLEAAIAPGVGNMVVSLRSAQQELLRFPFESVDAFLAAGGGLQGIPLLAPWANRLDETAFYANGARYAFDLGVGNVSGPVPIHGLLATAPGWEVVTLSASAETAAVTSRLEFFRFPKWMKQFPFAHTIEITHRLAKGALEVRTRIENVSRDPMPVSIGFHPYFRLSDSPRDDWTVSLGAAAEWRLDDRKIPTGERVPVRTRFADPTAIALRDVDLDHVFGDLSRDRDGMSVTSVAGRRQRIDVGIGPGYRAVVVYAPSRPAAGDRNFICIEPMAGITNAMNLAHRGLYPEAQTLPPGAIWEEGFWIRPAGFF